MNYDELAQRVVALGYGIKTKMTAGHHSWWVYSYNQTAEQFCNDGGTVLAMMEKCSHISAYWDDTGWSCDVVGSFARRGIGEHDGMVDRSCLAIAILTACCDALEEE